MFKLAESFCHDVKGDGWSGSNYLSITKTDIQVW